MDLRLFVFALDGVRSGEMCADRMSQVNNTCHTNLISFAATWASTVEAALVKVAAYSSCYISSFQ